MSSQINTPECMNTTVPTPLTTYVVGKAAAEALEAAVGSRINNS